MTAISIINIRQNDKIYDVHLPGAFVHILTIHVQLFKPVSRRAVHWQRQHQQHKVNSSFGFIPNEPNSTETGPNVTKYLQRLKN